MAFFGTHLPEKAFSVCIKDGIFIDQTCGSGGFFYKGYNFVELYKIRYTKLRKFKKR